MLQPTGLLAWVIRVILAMDWEYLMIRESIFNGLGKNAARG